MSSVLNGWLWRASGRVVEHLPMPHPGQPVDHRVVPQGVMHTIEGSLESGLSVFRKHYSPTFTVGGNRIIQHIPLGYMAAALEHSSNPPTNGWARAQIETQGHSQTRPWLWDKQTFESVAHLLAALSMPTVAGIPLERPWSDLMEPPPWATSSFARRLSGHWGRVPGWYGHVEIPENSHWDPGALEWGKLLARAKVIRANVVKHPKPQPKPRGGGGRALVE